MDGTNESSSNRRNVTIRSRYPEMGVSRSIVRIEIDERGKPQRTEYRTLQENALFSKP